MTPNKKKEKQTNKQNIYQSAVLEVDERSYTNDIQPSLHCCIVYKS